MDVKTLKNIERRIFLIRGEKVMLDRDLAELYQVPVKRLNEAVKRNKERFPADFMFQLTDLEAGNLKSQIATSSSEWGGRRRPPYAFTEQGVAMLSSVLKSKKAVHVNIAIMRAFVRLRQILSENKELAGKLAELEQKIGRHDREIQAIFEALRQMLSTPQEEKKKIGFHARFPA